MDPREFLPTLAELEAAAAVVYGAIPPTPQIRWPLLCARAGAEVWVKHENHTSVGAFKLRGGLVYMDHLRRHAPDVRGVIAATRGNHGQSVAFAAARAGLPAVIVVPFGNSPGKNAAMRALGAELIEQGRDFQAALEFAKALAETRQLHLVPPFDRALLCGVATAAREFFSAVRDLDALYVPVGMGSGICAAMAVRDALGLKTEIVGAVAASAPAYARSFAARRPVACDVGPTIADGLACRAPDARALEAILQGVSRVIAVEEEEIRAAMRFLFADTHNAAEGAGAAPLAALLRERDRMRGRRVGLMLTGGNVDSDVFADVLAAGS